MLVEGLRLDDRDGVVGPVAQYVVGALLLPAPRLAADEDDAAVREGALLVDGMGLVIPARLLELGHNELATGVGLCQPHQACLSGQLGGTFSCVSRASYSAHIQEPTPSHSRWFQ